jgi:hypothetical protein
LKSSRIKCIELENIESKILYRFTQNDDEIKIHLKPGNINNYRGWIVFDISDKRCEVPIDVLFGERGFNSIERDRFPFIEHLDVYLNNNNRLKIDNEVEVEERLEELTIYDVTDNEINGYSKYSISEKSMWLFNGKRRCNFFKGSIGIKDIKNYKEIKFSINTIDKENVEYFEEVKIEGDKCNFTLDTEKIGELISKVDPEGIIGKCSIHLISKKTNPSFEIVYPLEIKFIDLTFDENIHDRREVSIDFGTSSTCVSYGNNKMLHFSNKVEENSEREYENMTSFIIYSWDRVKKEWQDGINIPHMIKAENNLSTDELRVDKDQAFGDGESVRVLMEAPSKEILGATISDIKGFSLSKNEKRFRQFIDYKVSHDLKLGFSSNDDLNPIEFYAYQIGRKLNSTVKGKVYTRYHLTMPVKYSSKAKERIKDSFKYGLERSLPTNLRHEIVVRSKYNEPTALLGSLLLDYFNELKKPKFFSIFDFGGGTLDYVFGVVRPIYEEKKFSLKDEGEYEYVVELFNSGGSNECGGEKILRKMAYRIYLQNADKLGDEVPIMIPEGEEKDDRINSVLYGDDIKNRVNLEMIVERVAREILYSIKVGKENGAKCWTSSLLGKNEIIKSSILQEEELSIEIRKNNNISDEIDYHYTKSGISFQTMNSNNSTPYDLDINVKELIDLYINIISDNIEGYKSNLESIINSECVQRISKELEIEVDLNSFNIFLAGNSCKSKAVKILMKKNLEYNEIQSVNSERYSLKTAVARGYNLLGSDYLIHNWNEDSRIENNNEPFRYKIIRLTPNKIDVDTIIPKNSYYNENFKRLCGLEDGSNTFEINYTESDKHMDRFDNEIKQKVVVIPDDIMKKYVEGRGRLHIYINAFDYDSIIYGFGKKKEINMEVLGDLKTLKEKCVITL